ncbi:MAG: Dabb family protein [Clostridia bacterium]|nr:Dabb family protein [Clostridia bacterium]
MVRHIVIWKFHSSLSPEEKREAAEKIREGLESLNGRIPGLISLKVSPLPLPSSTGDAMLDSSFEDERALEGYRTHPLHLEKAAFVRSVTESRASFDSEI